MRSLYWLRSDLRLDDNPTLKAFCEQSAEGAIVFFNSASHDRAGAHRKIFIKDCLDCFAESLATKKLDLLYCSEPMATALPQLLKELKIEQVYFSKASAVEEANDENTVVSVCNKLNVKHACFDHETLVHPSHLPFAIADLPATYTQFRQQVEAHLSIVDPMPVPTKWPTQIGHQNPIAQKSAPSTSSLFSGGEPMALHRLNEYLWVTQSVTTYKDTRNGLLNWNDSTKLSAWFSQGCLSPRRVYSELKKYEIQIGANESTYWVFFELLWRDYFKFLSRKYRSRIFSLSGLHELKSLPKSEDSKVFHEWCNGQTHDRFVNANMNELNQTGWMSNRGRQNVASYMIHTLGLPWIWGAAYFEQQLVDYDPDLNWGNWLYLSGQGSDPRSRVFNTQKQAAQYDPLGAYQNKWVSDR